MNFKFRFTTNKQRNRYYVYVQFDLTIYLLVQNLCSLEFMYDRKSFLINLGGHSDVYKTVINFIENFS